RACTPRGTRTARGRRTAAARALGRWRRPRRARRAAHGVRGGATLARAAGGQRRTAAVAVPATLTRRRATTGKQAAKGSSQALARPEMTAVRGLLSCRTFRARASFADDRNDRARQGGHAP